MTPGWFLYRADPGLSLIWLSPTKGLSSVTDAGARDQTPADLGAFRSSLGPDRLGARDSAFAGCGTPRPPCPGLEMQRNNGPAVGDAVRSGPRPPVSAHTAPAPCRSLGSSHPPSHRGRCGCRSRCRHRPACMHKRIGYRSRLVCSKSGGTLTPQRSRHSVRIDRLCPRSVRGPVAEQVIVQL